MAEQPDRDLERLRALLTPMCARCEEEQRQGGRVPVVLPDPDRRLEQCAWCGAQTREGIYVFKNLSERYRPQLEQTVGEVGRMVALSKSGYRECHPDRVPVFGANLALRYGKVWHGDLDLSVDEPALVELARRVGQSVYVLYESDGRFEHACRPVLERAVYQVNQEGLCRFDHRFIVRDRDGVLRPRPPERAAGRRLVLSVGWPRLWRFWRHELVRHEQRTPSGRERTSLRYLGERGTHPLGRSPLLVLGLFRTVGEDGLRGFEWTWYPTAKRYAPRPLLLLRLRWRRGRYRPYLAVHIHPGLFYAVYAGIRRVRS